MTCFRKIVIYFTSSVKSTDTCAHINTHSYIKILSSTPTLNRTKLTYWTYCLPVFLTHIISDFLTSINSGLNIYCCITDYPKTQQLKTTHIYYLTVPVHPLSWVLPFRVSYNEAIKVLAGVTVTLRLIGGRIRSWAHSPVVGRSQVLTSWRTEEVSSSLVVGRKSQSILCHLSLSLR